MSYKVNERINILAPHGVEPSYGAAYSTSMVELQTESQTDPLRRRPLLRMLRNWKLRHQLPFNFWIHMVGIPLAVAGVVLLFYLPWFWGFGALAGGYLLQYVGHLAEGNDVGEWAAIKRLLGLPYVSIAPRWQQTSLSEGTSQIKWPEISK